MGNNKICNNDGNVRNTWKNYEKALAGNNIVLKLDLLYQMKNGIEDAQRQVNEWI